VCLEISHSLQTTLSLSQEEEEEEEEQQFDLTVEWVIIVKAHIQDSFFSLAAGICVSECHN